MQVVLPSLCSLNVLALFFFQVKVLSVAVVINFVIELMTCKMNS